MKHHADDEKDTIDRIHHHRSKLAAVTSPHVVARIVRSVLAAYSAEIAEL